MLSRIRAGPLEQGPVDGLVEAQLSARPNVSGIEHDDVALAFVGQVLRFDLNA